MGKLRLRFGGRFAREVRRGVLIGKFKCGSIVDWHIPRIVVARENLMVRTLYIVLL